MKRAQFETQFNSRTLAYQPAFRSVRAPVVVELGPAGHTPAGHLLASSLANLLARAHRRLLFAGEFEAGLLCPSPFGHATLAEATAGLAREINPPIEIEVVERAPRSGSLAHISLGAGGDGLSLGCEGWLARSGRGARIGAGEEDLPGAMLAACLGAWFSFARLVGQQPRLGEHHSLWDPSGGAQGPALSGPLQLGRVLQVGAGGVGAAFDLWLACLGLAGRLVIVDGDAVEVSNLNRQILFTAADAGYPQGEAANKSSSAAAHLGPSAIASPRWYGEDAAIVEDDYDVVLALANERGAREALQDRRPALLLHATTSPNHQAQFHRHLPGRDDCIRCRLPGKGPVTACASATVGGEDGDDASLPYLSALAGLMLTAALARHSLGELKSEPSNLLSFDLSGSEPLIQRLRCSCRQGCGVAAAAA